MEPIKHSLKDIDEILIKDDAVNITFKDEETPGAPGKPPGLGLGQGGAAAAVIKPPTSYPKPLSTDSISITLDDATFKFDDATGNLLIPDVTIAKEIVQDYHRGDKIVKVLKSADELKVAADFMEGVWIVADHPLDENGDVRLVAGVEDIGGKVLNPRYISDEKCNRIVGDLEITGHKIIADVKSGKTREVSIGFQSKDVEEKGKFGDDEYSVKQTGIFIDHVAIVENGRCSLNDGCGIVNADKDKDKPPAGDPDKPAEKTDVEKKMLADAEKIVKAQREELEGSILKISDARTKEELGTMDVDVLRKDLGYFADAKKEARKSVGITVDEEIDPSNKMSVLRSDVDKAYEC